MPPDRSLAGPLRIGFLALTDSAPLIVADREDIFGRHGLAVSLSREVGWASIREKIIRGELDAALAPAPMLWAIQLGLGCPACAVLTGLIVSLNGNAITLSREFLDPGPVGSPPKFKRPDRPLTLGVVFRYSAHYLLLREWLSGQGLELDKDVRIVAVPPAQMVRNLEAGTIDGFAAGEPWNTVAVRSGIGWCPTWTTAERHEQVEKVLLVTRHFAETHPAEHAALIGALLEACAWCEQHENRATVADLLSARSCLNLPSAMIAPSLLGQFDAGHGLESVEQFHIFHGSGVNNPKPETGMELQTQMVRGGLIPRDTALAKLLFRSDLHESMT